MDLMLEPLSGLPDLRGQIGRIRFGIVGATGFGIVGATGSPR